MLNENDLKRINALIDRGEVDSAKKEALALLQQINASDDNADVQALGRFLVASLLVDVASMSSDHNLAETAVKHIEAVRERVVGKSIEPHHYYYNLGNAKVNLIRDKSVFDLSFSSIETLVAAKNVYWRSVKEAQMVGGEFPEQYVNLANCLKRQFRFSEALWYYDHVLSEHPGIPQAWTNRSEALLMLNTVSNTFSAKMLDEAATGYENAAKSRYLPSGFSEYYKQRADDLRAKIRNLGVDISADDHAETLAEFEALSAYRRYCCVESLTLSEHGLYCACAGTARDNLTIPMTSTTIGGVFVPQMEAVLNRLKSEFSMARRCFYEYFIFDDSSSELLHEECFTDLHTNECLGLNFEKLRTAFRICFGILDKIVVAIGEQHSLMPAKGNVYFNNFWRLDSDDRRRKFEEIKDPGLLSLYSLATDLNEHKMGEWHEFKRLRNAMEHGFLVITHTDEFDDALAAYEFSKEVEFVSLTSFEQMTRQMLQITRSAIFSFVFSIRIKGMESPEQEGEVVSFQRIGHEGQT